MTNDLRIERLIDGTPEEIFDGFTQADAMKEWYAAGTWTVEVLACDVRVGGTSSVEFGPVDQRYREDMTYTKVDRPHALAYDEAFVQPNGESFDTHIEITLEPQDSKTLLTLVQTGFPDAEQRDAHQNGWPGFIDRLEQAVAKRRVA
jgi:uncharacterized protein YndB with AHSA1/START domain